MTRSVPEGATPYAAIAVRLEAWLSGPRWLVGAVVALLASALFLATPAWERLPKIERTTPWRVFAERVKAPLSQPRATEASHSGKTAFRLVVPVFARLFALGPRGVLAAQAIAGVALLALALQLGLRETGDRVTAFYLAAGLAFSYVGKAAFVDLFCWFDSWAFLFLLAALASRGPLLPFVFATLAAWTDERAVIALGLAVAFHLAPTRQERSVRLPVEALAVLAAVVGYATLRLGLARAFSLHTPTDDTGLAQLVAQLPLVALGTWTGLEGQWILVLAAFWTWRVPRARLALVVSVLVGALLLIVSWSVIDMTRSAAYAFPAVFVAVRLLAGGVPIESLRGMAFSSALVSLLFQDHYLQTGWQQPYLLRLLGP
jgi:hypothetical protein